MSRAHRVMVVPSRGSNRPVGSETSPMPYRSASRGNLVVSSMYWSLNMKLLTGEKHRAGRHRQSCEPHITLRYLPGGLSLSQPQHCWLFFVWGAGKEALLWLSVLHCMKSEGRPHRADC